MRLAWGGTATPAEPQGACPMLTVAAAAGGDGAGQLACVPALRLGQDAELAPHQPLQLAGGQIAQHLREVGVLPGGSRGPRLSPGAGGTAAHGGGRGETTDGFTSRVMLARTSRSVWPWCRTRTRSGTPGGSEHGRADGTRWTGGVRLLPPKRTPLCPLPPNPCT